MAFTAIDDAVSKRDRSASLTHVRFGVINRHDAYVRIWGKPDIRSLFLETEASSVLKKFRQVTLVSRPLLRQRSHAYASIVAFGREKVRRTARDARTPSSKHNLHTIMVMQP